MDELSLFRNFRDDNVVVLRCDALGGGAKLPIAWHRAEHRRGPGGARDLWTLGR